jgi:hypothetical protein
MTDLRDRPVTRDEVRALVRRTYSQPVVSLYLDLGSERTVREPPVYVTAFNSMRHQELAARQELVDRLSRAQRMQLHRDLDEVEALVRGLDAGGTRSLVVFRSGAELDRVARMPVATADSLTIDLDPHVAPLEAVLEEQLPVLVVEVSREDARLWSVYLGRWVRIETVRAMAPTDPVDASRPGKVQRHRETHLGWHLRSTAELVDRALGERGHDLLVLSGDQQVLAELERLLPERARERARTIHPSPHESVAEWRARVERILEERRREVEEDALSRLGEYAGHGLLASGLRDVLDAVNRFAARRLFVSAGLARPGWMCLPHRVLSLEAGRCPVGGEDLLPVEDVVDELVEVGRLHGVDLLMVERRPDLLEAHGGVAAALYEPEAPPA